MTLQEFLDLKLLRDNIELRLFKDDTNGLGSYCPWKKEELRPNVKLEHFITKNTSLTLTRNIGLITKELLIEKLGLPIKYFNYEIKEISGTKYQYRTAIVLKAKDE